MVILRVLFLRLRSKIMLFLVYAKLYENNDSVKRTLRQDGRTAEPSEYR